MVYFGEVEKVGDLSLSSTRNGVSSCLPNASISYKLLQPVTKINLLGETCFDHHCFRKLNFVNIYVSSVQNS